MAAYKVKCTVCGAVFLSKNSNAKYCSPLCRVNGAKEVRKEWEKSSRYQEKQRERMQAKRLEERRAIQEKKNARRSKTLSIVKKEDVARKEKYAKEMHEKAQQGDLNARQALALERGDTLEYWRLYRERLLLSEKEFGNTGHHTVGSIDVHEETFEYLVIEQLKK